MHKIIIVWLIMLSSAAFVEETVRVIDGDTIKIGKITVRLDRIDAPEFAQMCAIGDN